MLERYDIAIVGGGPAGLAAGIAAGRRGLRTLIIDRKQLPNESKVCGEGLMPSGLAVLRNLGVMEHLARADFQEFRGIRYTMDGTPGTGVAAEFAEGPGQGIARRNLGRAMLSRLADFDCVEVREKRRCVSLERSDDGMQLRLLDRSGREEVVASSLVIGADGLSSTVRKLALLDRPARRPGGNRPRWGARWHFPVAPWTGGFVDVHFAAPSAERRGSIEAYVTPVGPRETGVAFLWDRERLPEDRTGELYEALLAEFPEVRARIGDAQPLPDGGAVGPLRRAATAQTADGIVLMGDAAGYLDAMTGEGLSLAFEQALAFEASVVPLLTSGDRKLVPVAALRGYQRRYRAIVRSYYFTTSLVLWLSRHPRLFARVLRGLAFRPAVFRHMLSVNMGTRSMSALPVTELPGFAWGMMRG